MKASIIPHIFFAGLLSVSCTSEEPLRHADFVEVYHYEAEDTVISAEPHELTLSMVGDNRPKDWGLYEFKVWRGANIPDTVNRYTLSWETPEAGFIYEGNTFGVDWITFEKEPTPTSPKLGVTVKRNDTGEYRAAMVVFGNEWDNHLGDWCGTIIIVQKPAPDMEPFTMKIRYKGIMYSTTASLNMNGEIEYTDPEFSRVMEEIDALEDVEAIVMEDDVVDYYDMSDTNASKSVAKLRQEIDTGKQCGVIAAPPSTRANDAYRFERADAIGYFAMFDDTGFSDSYVFKNLNDLNGVYDVNYMKDIGLNDKVSSLAVEYKGTDPGVCSVLTVWEDSHYNYGDKDRTKHRISIIATKDHRRVSVSKLKSVKCINSNDSWNDRISSFSFAFGNYDSHLKDY